MQFNKEEGKDVHEAKLKVVYVSPPQPPSPITESNEEEGNSPKASPVVDNGERHHLLLDPVIKRASQILRLLWVLEIDSIKCVVFAVKESFERLRLTPVLSLVANCKDGKRMEVQAERGQTSLLLSLLYPIYAEILLI